MKKEKVFPPIVLKILEEKNENNAPKKDPTLLQIIERFDGEIIT